MATKEDAQGGLWDREIESPEIEEAITRMFSNREAAKEYGKAREAIRRIIEEFNLGETERVRCGPYVIHGRARAGGGFSVPTWAKVGIGEITEL